MSALITDTERVDWLASMLARYYGCEPHQFRDNIDARIAAGRGDESEWINLTVEFPPDETPVTTQGSDGKTGVVCYCSEAGDWYMHYPGSDLHGRLWSEVYGPKSEVVRWKAAQAR